MSKLIQNHKTNIIFIQEREMENIDMNILTKLWGFGDFDFPFKVGEWRSRGMLMIWDCNNLKI